MLPLKLELDLCCRFFNGPELALDEVLENRRSTSAVRECGWRKIFFSDLLPVLFLLHLQSAFVGTLLARLSPQYKKKVVVLFSYQQVWWAVEDANRVMLDKTNP
jgi:hypothetical protein